MILSELRRNPEVNQKKSVIDILAGRLENAPMVVDMFGRKSATKNLFVSFTSEAKLGINPKSLYNSTPLGIYAYPASFVAEHSHTANLPFAGSRPFTQVFTIRDNAKVVVLNNLSLENIEYLQERLADATKAILTRYDMVQIGANLIKRATSYITEGRPHAFWSLVFSTAENLSGYAYDTKVLAFRQNPANRHDKKFLTESTGKLMSIILRLMGIDFVIDEGDGIIHTNERSQAFAVSKSAIDHIDQLPTWNEPGENVPWRRKLKDINQYKELIASGMSRVDIFLAHPKLMVIGKPTEEEFLELVTHGATPWRKIDFTLLKSIMSERVIDAVIEYSKDFDMARFAAALGRKLELSRPLQEKLVEHFPQHAAKFNIDLDILTNLMSYFAAAEDHDAALDLYSAVHYRQAQDKMFAMKNFEDLNTFYVQCIESPAAARAMAGDLSGISDSTMIKLFKAHPELLAIPYQLPSQVIIPLVTENPKLAGYMNVSYEDKQMTIVQANPETVKYMDFLYPAVKEYVKQLVKPKRRFFKKLPKL